MYVPCFAFVLSGRCWNEAELELSGPTRSLPVWWLMEPDAQIG